MIVDFDKLLSEIKVTKTLLGKSKMTSGNAYRITLTHNCKRCSFVFNDNFKNASTLKDWLSALVCDADCYVSARDLTDFMQSYGYRDEREAKKAYNACAKNRERLNRLFTFDEETAIRASEY